MNAICGAKGIQVFIHRGSRDPSILHLLALTGVSDLTFPTLVSLFPFFFKILFIHETQREAET